jgi:serine protease Do
MLRSVLAARFRSTSSPVTALTLAGVIGLLGLSGPAAAQEKIYVELGGARQAPINIPSLAPLVKRAGPACLVVYNIGRKGRPGPLPPGHPPAGGGGQLPPGTMGQGAGFIIHPSGYALTNHHVIERAASLKVTVGTDTQEIEAEVLGSDKRSDVALIKLKSERTDWPTIPLGDSDALEVGDFVVAIGNPFGLDQTVSLGILSARGRRDVSPSSRNGLYDFLQTDAAINPGNSGGPLLNLRGEAVGMNTAVNAAAQGIGFAIPVNMVKAMLDDLRREGRVVRSWLGIGIRPVSSQLAGSLGLPRPMGALVRQVVEGGPAASAGLQPGDVITHFDGKAIQRANLLPLLAADAGVGSTVPLSVWRDGKEVTVSVKLEEHPDNAEPRTADDEPPAPSAPSPPPVKAGKQKIGLKLVTLNDADRERLDLEADVEGARVVGVIPGSPAASSGLRTDDVIVKTNGLSIERAQDFAELVKQTRSGEVLRLLIRREGSTQFVALIKP